MRHFRAQKVKDTLTREDVLYSIETAILNRDEQPALMKQAARCSCLTVLPRPYGADRTEPDERMTQGALFAEQSMRAIKMARPLLETADTVAVVSVGKDIGTFLSRHRINVKIEVVAHTGDPMSEMILDHVRGLNASLIYCHAPLRKFLFDGATRPMMKESDIPILMAH